MRRRLNHGRIGRGILSLVSAGNRSGLSRREVERLIWPDALGFTAASRTLRAWPVPSTIDLKCLRRDDATVRACSFSQACDGVYDRKDAEAWWRRTPQQLPAFGIAASSCAYAGWSSQRGCGGISSTATWRTSPSSAKPIRSQLPSCRRQVLARGGDVGCQRLPSPSRSSQKVEMYLTCRKVIRGRCIRTMPSFALDAQPGQRW